jgi:hypothetical protein
MTSGGNSLQFERGACLREALRSPNTKDTMDTRDHTLESDALGSDHRKREELASVSLVSSVVIQRGTDPEAGH